MSKYHPGRIPSPLCLFLAIPSDAICPEPASAPHPAPLPTPLLHLFPSVLCTPHPHPHTELQIHTPSPRPNCPTPHPHPHTWPPLGEVWRRWAWSCCCMWASLGWSLAYWAASWSKACCRRRAICSSLMPAHIHHTALVALLGEQGHWGGVLRMDMVGRRVHLGSIRYRFVILLMQTAIAHDKHAHGARTRTHTHKPTHTHANKHMSAFAQVYPPLCTYRHTHQRPCPAIHSEGVAAKGAHQGRPEWDRGWLPSQRGGASGGWGHGWDLGLCVEGPVGPVGGHAHIIRDQCSCSRARTAAAHY